MCQCFFTLTADMETHYHPFGVAVRPSDDFNSLLAPLSVSTNSTKADI